MNNADKEKLIKKSEPLAQREGDKLQWLVKGVSSGGYIEFETSNGLYWMYRREYNNEGWWVVDFTTMEGKGYRSRAVATPEAGMNQAEEWYAEHSGADIG